MNQDDIIDVQHDWRKRTCGECGWAKIVENYCENDITIFVCRHRSSDLMWPTTEEACPAFVPREVKT